MLAMPLSKVTEILRKYPRERGGTCRDDSVETRVAIVEVLATREFGELSRKNRGRAFKSACTGKEGPGTALGGGFSRGYSRDDDRSALCARRTHVRNDPREGEKEDQEERERDRGKAPREVKKERAPEVLSTKIAIPRRASRHCRLARSTWGRKVRESTRRWREHGEIERGRGRKDVRQGAYEGARRTEVERPDASYHDAQGETPRASLEGEREKVEGADKDAAAGVAKTLIRSSSHVDPFLYRRFFLSSSGRFEWP